MVIRTPLFPLLLKALTLVHSLLPYMLTLFKRPVLSGSFLNGRLPLVISCFRPLHPQSVASFEMQQQPELVVTFRCFLIGMTCPS